MMKTARQKKAVVAGFIPAIHVFSVAIALLISSKPASADLKICNRMSYVVEAAIGIEEKSATATRWCPPRFPASEDNAPFGMRITTDGMCSNESGIDKSKMFIMQS